MNTLRMHPSAMISLPEEFPPLYHNCGIAWNPATPTCEGVIDSDSAVISPDLPLDKSNCVIVFDPESGKANDVIMLDAEGNGKSLVTSTAYRITFHAGESNPDFEFEQGVWYVIEDSPNPAFGCGVRDGKLHFAI